MSSSDETVSYSDEEVVLKPVDSGNEMDIVEDIMEDQEILQQQEIKNGKQKAPKKATKTETNIDMWGEIQRLQQELNALKRPRQECNPASTECAPKKKKVDFVNITVNSNGGAYDRPESSRKMSDKQLSSAKESPLSSAKSKQLSSATSKQLSSVSVSPLKLTSLAKVKLSSSQQQSNDVHSHITDEDDDVNIHDEHFDNDPLRAEAEEIQRAITENLEENEEVSSDEDEGEVEGGDIFADLVGGVSVEGDNDRPGPPLTQIWADKLNLAWKTKMNKSAHVHLLQKYKVASNLDALKVPAVNKEIWKPLNKWQKKADLNMTSCQRSLMCVVSAVLKLHDFITPLARATRQIAMQTSADIVSLLGKVNRELMQRRKVSARSVLIGDYKSLATTTEASAENLFGDNLTQDIKDVNIRRKISDPNAYSYRSFRGNWKYNRGAYNTSNNFNSSSFLWRGRGRGRSHNRASHNPRYHSNSGQNYHKKH